MSARSVYRPLQILVPTIFAGAIVVLLTGAPKLALADDDPGRGAAGAVDNAGAAAQDSARGTSERASEPQPPAPSGAGAATERSGAQDVRQDAPETSRDVRSTARDAARDTREGARDASRDARGTSRELRNSTKDAARDTREDARDTSRDTRQDARGTSRELRRGARDTSRDVRTDSRDAVRDTRDAARDTRVDARVNRGRADRNLGLTFSTDSRDQLRVGELRDNSAFASSGIRRGDVIISINGRRLRSPGEFQRYYYQSRERVPVIILRDGRQRTIYFDPAPEEALAEYRSGGGGYLGVMLNQQRQDAAIVRDVYPNSPAQRAGFRRGDMIVAVEGQEITGPGHLTEVVGSYDPGTDVEIEIAAGEGTEAVLVTLGSRGGESVSAPLPRTGVAVRERHVDVQAAPAPPVGPPPGPAVVEPSGDTQVIINTDPVPNRTRDRGIRRARRNR